MIGRRDFLRWTGASGASLFFSHVVGCGPAEDPGPPLPPLPRDPEGRWWLDGNYAPVEDEVEITELDVIGSIPPELDGLFLRNGPNPVSGASPSWFFGDGMLHGVRIRDGRALWYRNRYIQTEAYTSGATAEGDPPLTANLANTAFIHHAGRHLALYEGGLPYEIAPFELETLGAYDFDGALRGAMTAHPKVDPVTGEMVFFGYGPFPPYLTVHFVDPAGALVRSVPVQIPGPRMIHDFALTQTHVVLMDLPVTFDLDEAFRGGFPFVWDPDLGARIGLLRRDAEDASDVRWMDVAPCFVFHTFNAYDDGDAVVLEAARHDTIWESGGDDESSEPQPWRFTLDPVAGTATESQLDDRLIEFPRIDARRMTLKNRVGYGLRFAQGERMSDPKRPVAVTKYDFDRGSYEEHTFPHGGQPDEAVFAPDPSGSGEDEGWVLSMVFDPERRGSEVMILDAGDLSGRPVATIRLPRRVPFGFHGDWLAAPASET